MVPCVLKAWTRLVWLGETLGQGLVESEGKKVKKYGPLCTDKRNSCIHLVTLMHMQKDSGAPPVPINLFA